MINRAARPGILLHRGRFRPLDRLKGPVIGESGGEDFGLEELIVGIGKRSGNENVKAREDGENNRRSAEKVARRSLFHTGSSFTHHLAKAANHKREAVSDAGTRIDRHIHFSLDFIVRPYAGKPSLCLRRPSEELGVNLTFPRPAF